MSRQVSAAISAQAGAADIASTAASVIDFMWLIRFPG
jgi:hypothetical protein